MILPILTGSTIEIMIMNCKTLFIETNQFVQLTQLQLLQFTNIENLVLKEKSLSFLRSSVRIHFTNVRKLLLFFISNYIFKCKCFFVIDKHRRSTNPQFS